MTDSSSFAPSVAPGAIILLNGTMGSGKTTLARLIQEAFEEPFLRISIDDFIHNVCPLEFRPHEKGQVQRSDAGWVIRHTDTSDLVESGRFAHFLLSGMHRTVATLAQMGHNVVVEHIFQEARWLNECLDLWRDLPVLFVGVHCPIDVLLGRNGRTMVAGTLGHWQAYGAGTMGFSPAREANQTVIAWQLERVHAHGAYDVEVDTSQLSPVRAMTRIRRRFDMGDFTAFKQLRSVQSSAAAT